MTLPLRRVALLLLVLDDLDVVFGYALEDGEVLAFRCGEDFFEIVRDVALRGCS
jgi:hypothetical protein